MRSSRLRFVLSLAALALLSGSLATLTPAAAAAVGAKAAPAPNAGHQGDSGASLPPSAFGNVAPDVEALSRQAESDINACDPETLKCIADILDDYAVALRRITPSLPPALANLPQIIATAAGRVRAAKTKQEMLRALKIAIVAVHKSIALLKADDPVVLKAATRTGDFVVETLQVADSKLEEAIGL